MRSFFSQVAAKSITTQIPQADLDFLTTSGYVSVMQKDEYDPAAAEVAELMDTNVAVQSEVEEERVDEIAMQKAQKKTHSIMFHLEGKEKKAAQLAAAQGDKDTVAKEQADIVAGDNRVADMIQKKSVIDRMVPYGGEYVALTGLGVVALNDLNVRNYRVADEEFTDFILESRETIGELLSIVQRGNFYVSAVGPEVAKADMAQLWSLSIGLAKLQGDPKQIDQRFTMALGILKSFKSNLDNKMMAAEIMTSSRMGPLQPSSPSSAPIPPATGSDNSDLQALSKTLKGLDSELRHDKVPKELSAGVAAMIMYGKRYDGTFPTDRFVQFTKVTSSFESAAILSVLTVPVDELTAKFQSYRALFDMWGYTKSEDTELASAYLSISDLGPADVKTKLSIIVDGLKNYLEYPLVAAAILASISTIEANETLDLMEKASSMLAPVARGLARPELVSLSVRMIHGIENGLVKQLDSTAAIADTPVQFTYGSSPLFFLYRTPLIMAHASYFATFSGIGGAHPAHVHGLGGFFG